MVPVIHEVITKRDLIAELVKKDVKLRYRGPALGFLWAFLSPFILVVIFYFIFHKMMKVEVQEAPFLAYIMTAIFAWKYTQDSLMTASTCLIDNRGLLKESRIPHYFFPLSVVLSQTIYYIPSLFITVGVCAFSAKGVPVSILCLPAVIMLHILLTAGAAVIVSILYVRWRDLKYILDSFLMLMFYLTPVFYSLSIIKGFIPPYLMGIYFLSPFVGIMTMYRVILLKDFALPYPVIPAIVWSLAGLAASIFLLIWFACVLYRTNKANLNDYLSF
jgi:lipopolysaccharide transport system permease protein